MQIGLIAAAIAAAPMASEPEAWFTALTGIEENEALVRDAAPAESVADWISPADIPASAVPAGQSMTSITVQVEVGADGRMTRCTAGEPGPLADIACAKLRERGKFVPALDRTGRAVAGTLTIELVYSPKTLPRVPPAPPMPSGIPWALMAAQSSLEMVAEPDWRNFVAPDRKRKGEVAVRVSRYMRDKPVMGCEVIASTSDPALDAATCNALKTARHREPSASYEVSTLLVRWKGNTARIERPVRTNGIKLAFDRFAAEQAVAALPEGANRGGARLTFAAGGKTVKCKIWLTTGIDSADLAACRKLETIPYKPAIDIYDRPRTAVEWVDIGRGS